MDWDIFNVAVETRICYACKKPLPLTEFQRETGTEGLRKTGCRKCLRENQRTGRGAKKTLGSRPPLGYVCPCGKKTYTGGGSKRDWSPDHDHATGRARFWLCRECNTGLGKLHDDPAALGRLIAYLVRYGATCDLETMVDTIQSAREEYLRREATDALIS